MLETTERQITDPSLLPSIVPRIRTILNLLAQARDAPSEQDDSNEHATTHERSMESTHSSDQIPNLALGTINDEDDWDMWLQADASTGSSKSRIPGALLTKLAHETMSLKATFAAAYAAVDAAPGADMSIVEQSALLQKLETYEKRQAYVNMREDTLTISGIWPTYGRKVWKK